MTLAEFLAKFEGVLQCTPMLRAELLNLVQDERADERKQCERAVADMPTIGLATKLDVKLSALIAIRNRKEKEVG